MPRHLLRVWLPDRPGSLGLVAAAIGGAGGDVVGVEILESGGGRAVDELVVECPDLPSVVTALGLLDGVDVEWATQADGGEWGPDLEALEAAVHLFQAATEHHLLGTLCELAARHTAAEWGVIITLDPPEVLAAVGDHPSAAWLAAFVAGGRLAPDGGQGVEDLCWGDVDGELAVVLGRSGHPFRLRERRRIRALAGLAAARLTELDTRRPQTEPG